MSKTMTRTNLEEFLAVLEKYTGYPVSQGAFDLAWKEFNTPKAEPETDGE